MSAPQTTQDSLSLTLTPGDLKIIAEAAAQSHKSQSDFILSAALEKARNFTSEPEPIDEEMTAILQALQEKVRRAVPDRHKAFEDFLAGRRAEAARD